MKHWLAIHTYSNNETKRDWQSPPESGPSTDEEFIRIGTFEKAKCLQQWMGTEDFFFCHWEAETEDDIYQALKELGSDMTLQTVVYESHRFVSAYNLTGKEITYPPFKPLSD
ncbi:hypothetical protein ACMAY8_03495 [Rhodobacteraceae bacterium nBUS_22]|jgi:hypothetical protein